MSEYKIEFEYINPTNVESEVPQIQPLRTETYGEDAINEEDTTKNGEDTTINEEENDKKEDSYVQVMTVKKEETGFTKGDLKLQKVAVTENISGNKQNGVTGIPIYSEVIAGAKSARQPLKSGSKNEEYNTDLNNGGKSSDDKKSRTRIPMGKFKQAAERVKERTKNSGEPEHEVVSRQTRRSSIPRLKGSKIPPPSVHKQKHMKKEESKIKTDKNSDIAQSNDIAEDKVEHDIKTPQTEDEFQRIYEEIIDKTTVIDDKVLVEKIDDPEELETSFEEIIHAYDENKIEPIKVDKIRSRIPLVKQSSLHDGEFSKRIDRRSSIKDTVHDKRKVEDSKDKVKKNHDFRKTSPKDEEIGDDNAENIEITTKDEQFHKTLDTASSEIASNETVRVVTPNFDKFIRENQLKREEQKEDDENLNREKVTDENTESGNESLSHIPDSSKLVKSLKNIYEPNKNDSNEYRQKPPALKKEILEKRNSNIEVFQKERDHDTNKDVDQKIPVARGKVSSLISKIASNEQNISEPHKKDVSTRIPKKSTIISKIAIFNGDKNQRNESQNEVRPKIPLSTSKVDKVVHRDTVSSKDTIKNEDNDSNNVVEDNKTPKAIHNEPTKVENNVLDTNKPVEASKPVEINETQVSNNILTSDNIDEVNVKNGSNDSYDAEKADMSKDIVEKITEKDKFYEASLTEEQVTFETFVPTVLEENVYRNLTNTKQAIEKDKHVVDTDIIKTDLEKERDEYTYVFKGRVSRIISRLDSHDERVNESSKKEVEIPKKKSVSSRIAIFERQTAAEVTKLPEKNPTKEYLKPKIIDEVLKTPAHEENIDKAHTVGATATYNLPTFVATNNTATGSNFEGNEDKENLFEDGQEETVKIIDDTVEYTTKVTKDDKFNEDNIEQIRKDNSESKLNTDIKENVTNEIDTEEYSRITYNNASETENNTNVLQKGVKNDNDEVFSDYAGKSIVESRKVKLKSTSEESSMRRTKSIAELDLGDAVKGKVHQMIVRINSMENILTEKKEVISAKERPRKRSVSEKIALFEGKLVPVQMESETREPTRKPEQKNPRQRIYSEDELQAKIAELNNAKITHGRMENMVYMKLNDGKEIPVLGLGTAGLDPQLIQHIIGTAIDLGYRAIDTAYIYGNERAVGEAIKAKIDDGTVKRENLFITSKLWSTFHRQDLVEKACRSSLEAMQLDYFDLYLIHNPMSLKEDAGPIPKIANVVQFSEYDYLDAWYGLEDLVAKGLVRSIGVSNFNSSQLARVLEKGRIKPSVNQVECHPYLSQQRLDEFCEERDVKIICFGVLGSKGTPVEWKNSTVAVIDDPLVKVMAAGLNITPAQLLIRYQIERGHSVVVKASSGARLWENLQALRVDLDAPQVDGLSALNRNRRTYTFKGLGDTHKNYPFKTVF